MARKYLINNFCNINYKKIDKYSTKGISHLSNALMHMKHSKRDHGECK